MRVADRTNAVIFILMVLVWGSSFLLIKISLEGFTAPQIALGRLILGAMALGIIMLVTRQRVPREPRLWGHMAVVAITQSAIPFTLTAWIVQYIPTSLAAIYNASAPTFTLLITPLLLKNERLTRAQVGGIALGIMGVVILVGPWRHVDASALATTLPAQLAMLLSAGIYAFGLVYMRRFIVGTPHDAVTISTMQVLLATGVLLLLAPFTIIGPVTLGWRPIVSMILLGALGTGAAYVWNTRIVRMWGASRASTVTYLMPVVGVALGVAILGETVHWNEPVGGLVILAGVLASQVARRGPDVLDSRGLNT